MKFFKIVLSISLLTFSFEVFAQSNKPVIGIGDMQSSVGGDVNTFRAMLETALANTNKFELIELRSISGFDFKLFVNIGSVTFFDSV